MFLDLVAYVFGLYTSIAAMASGCVIEDRQLSASDGFTIEWTEFQPPMSTVGARESERRTIIIMPPTGGVTPIDRRLATRLCRENQIVAVVKTWTGLEEPGVIDFELHNRHYTRANRVLGTLASTYPGPLRLLGTSLGAQYSVSALSRMTRFERAVLEVGGSPFSHVIADSNNREMKLLRDRRMAELGVKSQDDYRATLDRVFKWNDEEVLSEIPKRTKIMMVISLKDDAVPTANQLHLASLLNPVKLIRIEKDHVGTIVDAYLSHDDEILDFLLN